LAEELGSARRATAAPGQYYGYSLQTTRLLARLLECAPGESVSLEVLDDVAVSGPATTLVEQAKSGFAHNPITDRSSDLWKTLFNWLEAIRTGVLHVETTRFVLYVAQPYKGPIAEKLNAAKSLPDAIALLGELRTEFWGEAPDYTKRGKLAESIAPYVNSVLSAEDRIAGRIILAFELEKGSGSSGDDVRDSLRSKAIGDEAIEGVLEGLLGWVKLQTDDAIERGEPAVVDYKAFHDKLVALARRCDRSDVLNPTPAEISQAEIESELRDRTYVAQLRLIDETDQDQRRAVNDFLKASVDRVAWSESGEVEEKSLLEFRDTLTRRWQSSRTLVSVELDGRSETDRGRAVHARCMSYEGRLQGKDVPHYFTPGSFHELSENLVVGWHPRYVETLQRNAGVVARIASAGEVIPKDE